MKSANETYKAQYAYCDNCQAEHDSIIVEVGKRVDGAECLTCKTKSLVSRGTVTARRELELALNGDL